LNTADLVSGILGAARDYRIADYERALRESCLSLPPDELVNEVLAPVLREAGNRWHSGELSIVQEHMLCSAVRHQLFNVLDRYAGKATSPAIAFTTLSGERHELGSLMLAVVAASRGFRSIYLGSDLPAAEVGRFCARVEVVAVALSVVTSPQVIDAYAQLATLRALLPADVEIWVGGQAAPLLEVSRLPVGSRRMIGMEEFSACLASFKDREPR
jgi:methanogenic corrinoid protein MtbC1